MAWKAAWTRQRKRDAVIIGHAEACLSMNLFRRAGLERLNAENQYDAVAIAACTILADFSATFLAAEGEATKRKLHRADEGTLIGPNLR